MAGSTADREYTDMGEDDDRERDDEPVGKQVTCPSCDADTVAVVPKDAEIVDDGESSDGKVWTNCRECENRFLVYYRWAE